MPLALIFTALLVLQAGLVVTGGAVRLSGSGLGCPTWPECTKGSLKPVAHQAQGQLHAWIEFSNRLLTFVLFIAAIAAIIAVIRTAKGRSDYKHLRLLALLQLAGILGQGILGGITVLTHLNPIPVAGHFLLSIALIAGALSLRQRMLDRPRFAVKPLTFQLSRTILVLSCFVLTLGTVVTGSGPHAGDAQSKRFGFDPRTVSWIHADTVIALIALTVGLYFVIRASEPEALQPVVGVAVRNFFLICMGQGAIGYLQYFTHVPALLVGIHLFGAALVWIGMWNIIEMTTKEEMVKGSV